MIYLDYQATTPVAPEVVTRMMPWIGEKFANPHSPSSAGREAAAVIEHARGQVLRATDLQGGSLAFTGSATEAINWAIKGSMARQVRAGRPRLITIATEHAAVLDSAGWLDGQGVELVILPVDAAGIVDLDAARAAIDERTGLVAAMLVNNEIGVIQPIEALAETAHAQGALFLCDAVQGLGRVDIPPSCDLVALSAHKVHGPKAIGALWMRDGAAPEPLIHGGGQEGGLRSGTLNPALCVGFGEAARLLVERRETDHQHVEGLWDTATAMLGEDWTINGDTVDRYHGNLNIRRPGLDAARLLSDCRSIAFSLGSACASGSGRPSHVLRALGLDAAEARGSIRIGFGRMTSEHDLAGALTQIIAAADRQRCLPAA